MYLSIYLTRIYLFIYLSLCLSVCLSASLKTKLFCETSSGFELDNIKNAAILRDILNVWAWQRQKRSNSARLLHFFKAANIKTEAILRDFLQKWKVACSTDGLVPLRFAIFPIHLSKLLRLPGKSDARSYEVLHLSRKIISANLKILGSKCNPSQEISARTSQQLWWTCLLYCACNGKCILCRSSSNVPRLPSFLEMRQNPHVLLTFDKVHSPLHLPRETTS